MLIALSNLKDLALLLSNVLRDFDPQTMLWREDSPIIFPNYNINGFTPCESVRKPYSVQILLESFSRSCGYKSYNALLADQHKPKLLDVNLNDLNPAPNNKYYSLYWHTFIESICNSVHQGFIAQTIPSYLTYRNFKSYDEGAALAFVGWGIAGFCKPGEAYYSELEYVEAYYPIALSILLTAIDIGFSQRIKTDDNQVPVKIKPKQQSSGNRVNNDEYEWVLKYIPLKRFLVHEQWQDQDFGRFKSQLTIALYFLFGVRITFSLNENNPLDCLVSLVSDKNLAAELKLAQELLQKNNQIKQWVIEHCNAVSDPNYYIDLNYKAISTIRSNYRPSEFSWHTKNALEVSNNITHHTIFGTQAFWLNQVWHLFTPNSYGLLQWKEGLVEDQLENYLKHILQHYRNPIKSVEKRAIQFEIQGISKFIKNSNHVVNIQDIPKTLTVYSQDIYDTDILKLAIQAQIIALLPKEAYDFEIHTKHFGDPNTIQFDAIQPHLDEPMLKIKEISQEKYKSQTDLSFDFDFRNIIHSIGIERIPDNLIQLNAIKPYAIEIEDCFTPFDFDNDNSRHDDFMLTTGRTKSKHYCYLKIALYDTTYQSTRTYPPKSGWNELTAICEMDSLLFGEADEIKLELCYTYDETASIHTNRIKNNEYLCKCLGKSADFALVLQECFNAARLEWDMRKQYLNAQHPDERTLATLYEYLTYFPNGQEII